MHTAYPHTHSLWNTPYHSPWRHSDTWGHHTGRSISATYQQTVHALYHCPALLMLITHILYSHLKVTHGKISWAAFICSDVHVGLFFVSMVLVWRFGAVRWIFRIDISRLSLISLPFGSMFHVSVVDVLLLLNNHNFYPRFQGDIKERLHIYSAIYS